MDNLTANKTDTTNTLSEIDKLRARLQSADLPANLREKAIHQIDRIALTLKYGGNLSQIDITAKFIDWITTLTLVTTSLSQSSSCSTES